MTDRRAERDRERRERRKAREDEERRREEWDRQRKRRFEELWEAWLRNHPSEEEGGKDRPGKGREGTDAPLATTPPPEAYEPRGAAREPAPKIRRRRRRPA